jgi:serine/threonine-protein phosphatase 6 regulatory ankyrin repeat subunit B
MENFRTEINKTFGRHCQNGNVPLVEAFMTFRDCFDLDWKDENGMTFLHHAVRNDRIRVIDLLLEQGVKIDEQDNEGDTALHMSVYQPEEISIALLSNGASMDNQNNRGRTPLHEASFIGNTNLMKKLIVNGADKEVKDVEGYTPLFLASNGEQAESVKLLLQNRIDNTSVLDADIDTTDINGNTPLIVACDNGLIEIAALLIEKGADKYLKNNNGEDAKSIATRKKNTGILDLLHEASINDQNYKKKTI